MCCVLEQDTLSAQVYRMGSDKFNVQEKPFDGPVHYPAGGGGGGEKKNPLETSFPYAYEKKVGGGGVGG